jgi:hypothetical protein
MNDKEFADLKRRLRLLTDKWFRVIGLSGWSVKTIYHRGDYERPGGDALAAGLMHCSCDWQYLYCTVHVNMEACKDLDDEALTDCVVHEYLHCLTDELSYWKTGSHDDGHMEHLVATLTRVIHWTYNMGWNDGKADLRRKQKELVKGG